MTPQLFINYKLKSVAHLPWRMMTYKALNTFIDDIFAFVIKMPTLYRLGCFRDGNNSKDNSNKPKKHNNFNFQTQTLFSSSSCTNAGSTVLTRLVSTSLVYLSKCWKSVRTPHQMEMLLQSKVLLLFQMTWRSRRLKKLNRSKIKRTSNCENLQS